MFVGFWPKGSTALVECARMCVKIEIILIYLNSQLNFIPNIYLSVIVKLTIIGMMFVLG